MNCRLQANQRVYITANGSEIGFDDATCCFPCGPFLI
jgi:hypothetical protein